MSQDHLRRGQSICVVLDVLPQRQVRAGRHVGRLPQAVANRSRHQMRQDVQGARKSALLGDGLLRRQQARRQRIRGRQHLHLGHQQQQVGGAEAAGAQR
ncbi:unnamed protein product [Ectocarpus fasciculatus]